MRLKKITSRLNNNGSSLLSPLSPKSQCEYRILAWSLRVVVFWGEAIVKAKEQGTFVFKRKARAGTMFDDAVYGRSGDSIVLYQAQFARLLAYPKPIRDQVIIELPCEIGLRTGEICTLRVEHIDLETGDFIIRDSKNYKHYPLALTFTLAKHIQQLIATLGQKEQFLIRQESRSGKISERPMQPQSIKECWKRWARRTGIPNWKEYTPRLGRHYFAAVWAFIKKGNLEVLRRIMRHKSLAYTQIYLSRLIFYKDIKREVQRLQTLPIRKNQEGCDRIEICKFYEAANGGCKFQSICKHYKEVQTA